MDPGAAHRLHPLSWGLVVSIITASFPATTGWLQTIYVITLSMCKRSVFIFFHHFFYEKAAAVYFRNVHLEFSEYMGDNYINHKKITVDLYFIISRTEVKKQQSDYVML